MSEGPIPIGASIPLPGSPMGEFGARINTQLDEDAIPCACPHPVTADRLFMPSRILCCTECAAWVREVADQQQPECAVCGGPATGSVMWPHGLVVVMAQTCGNCQAAGVVFLPPD